MSYLRKIEYRVIPEESFEILRNCAGCGCKATFHNTNSFRVNANGNKVDVWLIYQCVRCKHTSNLTIYERRSPKSILQDEYEKFLSNSKELAFEYGTNSQFFARNRVEVDWSHIKYAFKRETSLMDGNEQLFHKGDLLVISNSYLLKIRSDKIVSEILNVTRSKMKEMERLGIINVTEKKQEHKIIIKLDRELCNEDTI